LTLESACYKISNGDQRHPILQILELNLSLYVINGSNNTLRATDGYSYVPKKQAMFPGSATALRFHFLVAVMQLKANNREVNRWSCYGHVMVIEVES